MHLNLGYFRALRRGGFPADDAVLPACSYGRTVPTPLQACTLSYDRLSVCRQHHEFSIKALEGNVPFEAADSWFAYIATLDAGDVWTDPTVWIKANPRLGVTVKMEYLHRQVDEATGLAHLTRL